jgi:hypothetical protein
MDSSGGRDLVLMESTLLIGNIFSSYGGFGGTMVKMGHGGSEEVQ